MMFETKLESDFKLLGMRVYTSFLCTLSTLLFRDTPSVPYLTATCSAVHSTYKAVNKYLLKS